MPLLTLHRSVPFWAFSSKSSSSISCTMISRAGRSTSLLAGQVVQLLAVHLDRRVHGRHLLLRTDKAPHHLLYRVFRGIAFAGLEHFAGDILRIRAVAEREPGNVFLSCAAAKSAALVAPPTNTGRTPVAIGSSVPP